MKNPLRQAANYIRDHGWTRGTLRDQNGQVCSLGAIRYANGFNAYNSETEACKYLAEEIVRANPYWRRRVAVYGAEDAIMSWNDSSADDVDEVIHFFKAAAEEWDIKHPESAV